MILASNLPSVPPGGSVEMAAPNGTPVTLRAETPVLAPVSSPESGGSAESSANGQAAQETFLQGHIETNVRATTPATARRATGQGSSIPPPPDIPTVTPEEFAAYQAASAAAPAVRATSSKPYSSYAPPGATMVPPSPPEVSGDYTPPPLPKYDPAPITVNNPVTKRMETFVVPPPPPTDVVPVAPYHYRPNKPGTPLTGIVPAPPTR